MIKLLSACTFLLLLWSTGSSQTISVEDFTTQNIFTERKVTGINWMNDGKFYTALQDNKIVKYDVTTGQPVQTLVDGDGLSSPVVIDDYSLSGDEGKILLQTQTRPIYRRSFVAEYFLYNIESQALMPLSSTGSQSYATFSPDGNKVAFVRENNLYLVTLPEMAEQQVTDDGKFNYIINGTTDWVYEEEFSFVVGFEWSPDGEKLAYYRFDETEVKEYNLQLWGNFLYPVDYRYKYPKAGEKNSIVEIWVYNLNSRSKMKVDLGSEVDIYIPNIKWTADPNLLSVRKLNRLQNHMTLYHANAATGQARVILDEKTDTYFDIEVLDIQYRPNGKEFIKMGEEDGYIQLFLYSTDGRRLRKLTPGEFDVMDFLGLDERTETLYYTSTEVSPLERHFYALSLDGKRKVKLSKESGVHDINISNDFQFYIDHHSSASHPAVVTLYRTKRNVALKVLERNEKLQQTVKERAVIAKDFFTFKNDSGIGLNGFMLKPEGFDSTKRYPVVLYQYSGPGSQEVKNAWGADHFYFHQMLAQKGYLVVFVDPRGTGARGADFKKITYKELGKYELQDHLNAATYLASLSFVDANRIGIWGWSYGGYISSLALTKGAGVFKMGIAVSPVTNWRFYDTVYTERYLQTPQLNPQGYDMNSPSTYADRLEGAFLLIHGTGDDNVHIQNSIVLQDALINAGKQFESFFYPDKQHAIAGPVTQQHLYSMMLNFIEKNL
jgi:dipeptidyl-peptidase 4